MPLEHGHPLLCVSGEAADAPRPGEPPCTAPGVGPAPENPQHDRCSGKRQNAYMQSVAPEISRSGLKYERICEGSLALGQMHYLSK